MKVPTGQVLYEDCRCIKDTEMAILVESPDFSLCGLWVPKSVIHDDSEVYKLGTEGDLIIPLWFAEKNGLPT